MYLLKYHRIIYIIQLLKRSSKITIVGTPVELIRKTPTTGINVVVPFWVYLNPDSFGESFPMMNASCPKH